MLSLFQFLHQYNNTQGRNRLRSFINFKYHETILFSILIILFTLLKYWKTLKFNMRLTRHCKFEKKTPIYNILYLTTGLNSYHIYKKYELASCYSLM